MPDGSYRPTRYFALSAMKIVIHNDARKLATNIVDRHLKSGYDTSTFASLDVPDESKPHFDPPLGEQRDVFRMNAVVPASWLDGLRYDWSKSGSLSITVSSIWDGLHQGHSHLIRIPLNISGE